MGHMPADGYDWLDALVYDGKLGETVRGWDHDGLTAEQIRGRILEHPNIPAISLNTVRRWLYRARGEAQATVLREQTA